MAKPILTQDYVKELFNYNPDTGVFIRLKRTAMCTKVGDVVGSKDVKGYLRTTIDRRAIKMHRLAFLYMNGEIPTMEIDHINGNRSDNRWINLRQATRSENQQNRRKASINNKSGFLGVSWKENKWQAIIKVNGKIISIGKFDNPELAHEAYLDAKRKLHSSCTI